MWLSPSPTLQTSSLLPFPLLCIWSLRSESVSQGCCMKQTRETFCWSLGGTHLKPRCHQDQVPSELEGRVYSMEPLSFFSWSLIPCLVDAHPHSSSSSSASPRPCIFSLQLSCLTCPNFPFFIRSLVTRLLLTLTASFLTSLPC